MVAHRKTRPQGSAAKEREFEKLLRRASVLKQDRKRPRRLRPHDTRSGGSL